MKISTKNTILIIFILSVILLFASFIAGYKVGVSSVEKRELTSRSIYERLTNTALLTSKTAYIDQTSTIDINNNTEWSSLLWGQSIKAKGLMKVSIGVDLAKIKEEDISVDNVSKKIVILLPNIEILSTDLEGDIEIVNKQGILKILLENNPNQDFNLALKTLKEDANKAVQNDPNIFKLAYDETVSIIKNFYKNTGYEVIVSVKST